MRKRDLSAELDQHSHVLEISIHKILPILSREVGMTSTKRILTGMVISPSESETIYLDCCDSDSAVLSVSFSP